MNQKLIGKKDWIAALKLLGVCTLLLGGVYTFVILGVSQPLFPSAANSSMVDTAYGEMSLQAGQMDYRSDHLWGRPVSYQTIEQDGMLYVTALPANDAYGSEQTEEKQEKLKAWIQAQSPDSHESVPQELYVSSASGMDPSISYETALYQIPRLSKATGLDTATLRNVLDNSSSTLLKDGPQEKTVNVIAANLAIDDLPHGGQSLR